MTLRVLFVAAILVVLPVDATAQGIPAQVEADARAYADRSMRHDSLLLKWNLKRTTNADVAEIDRLKAEGQQILAKYAPGRASAAAIAAFERRRKELSASVVMPGVRRAVAAHFPEPDEVRARYQTDVDRAAAISVLAEFLKDKTGGASVPEAAAKLRRYESAAAALDPGGRRVYNIRARREDPQFRFDTLSQFMPVYANEAGGAGMAKLRYEARVAEARSAVWRAVGVVAILVFAVPVAVLAVMKLRTRTAGRASMDPTPFDLPEDLRRIHLLGISLRVEYRCGQVMRKRQWTDTYTTTSYQPGKGRDASGMEVQAWQPPETAVRYDPATSSSVSTSVDVTEYTLTSPTGGKETVQLRGKDRVFEEGHIVSAAVVLTRGAIYYDHTTGRRFGSIATAGRLDRALWLFTWVGAAVVAYLAYGAIVEPQLTLEVRGAANGTVQTPIMALYGVVLLAIPYVSAVSKYVARARDKKLDTAWTPRFEAYCKSVTPAVVAQYVNR